MAHGEAQLEQARAALEQRYGLSLTGLTTAQLRVAFEAAWAQARWDGPSPPSDFLEAWLDHLPINESSLFRNQPLWDYLEHQVFPGLLEATRTRPVHVVSLGCSSGQEPFSLAMRLLELAEARGQSSAELKAALRITGVDPSPLRLAQAASGVLNAWSVERGHAGWAARWVKETQPGLFRVDPAVRQLCHFERGNLLDFDVSARPVDLMLCQNVLVYFSAQAAQRAVGRLAAALPEGALLVLAPVEAHLLLEHGRLQPQSQVGAARVAEPAAARTAPALPHVPRPSRPPGARPSAPAPPPSAPRPSAPRPMVTHEDLSQPALASRLLLARRLHPVDPGQARRVLETLLADAQMLAPDTRLPGEELSAGQVCGAARALLEVLR